MKTPEEVLRDRLQSIYENESYPPIYADVLLSDLREAGYAVVPREPTEAMLDYAWGHVLPVPGYPLSEWADVYRAMLAAAEGKGE